MVALADEHGNQLEVEDRLVIHTVIGLLPLFCVEYAGLVLEVLRDCLLDCGDVGPEVVVGLAEG